MKIKKIVISALSGSTGKTFVTLGLMRAFTLRGLKVRAFKKGPDYIDTAWHSIATGLTACNLDPFFMSEGQIQELFNKRMLLNYKHEENTNIACDLAIIEGNRGLFDGLDIEGSCSTATLAKTLQAPVILTINATKMTRTIAALVNGCVDFDKELNIAGVIANRTGSQRHGELIANCIKKYCKPPFLGFLPRLKVNPILERDTGLIALSEIQEIDNVLNELAAFVETHLNLDQILELASNQSRPVKHTLNEDIKVTPQINSSNNTNIGYIKDSFFWQIYHENLEALEEAGANLIPLELNNATNWKNIQGLYIPSGSAESFVSSLNNFVKSENYPCNWLEIMNVLKKMSQNKIPIYAEGTGAWLLSEKLIIKNQTYPMSAILPFTVNYNKQKRGLGYVVAKTNESPFFIKDQQVLGHEFNYASWILNDNAQALCAFELLKGGGLYKDTNNIIKDGVFINNTQASSTQIHSLSNMDWAKNFVRLTKQLVNKN